MSEQRIENHIDDVLADEARKNALELAAFLRVNEMQFERGMGYWQDKFYWMIKYKDEYVCFILISNGEDNTEPDGLTIWTDNSGSNWFEDSPLDERMKEIAWKHIDICGKCGGCENPGGSHKTVFGKDFNDVCITTMRFENPDAETIECVKKLLELRKTHIDFSKITAYPQIHNKSPSFFPTRKRNANR